jgi:hypothetical protein
MRGRAALHLPRCRASKRRHSGEEDAVTDRGLSKEDRERNEDPEKIGGAVAGATGAGTGAAIGSVLGPAGTVIGALAGATGGWWAGKGLIGAVEEVDRSDNAFRRAHEHAGARRPYEEDRHGYQLGFLAGRNPDYDAADFDAVEDDLRTAWVKAHLREESPVPWEDVRACAREGFRIARKQA